MLYTILTFSGIGIMSFGFYKLGMWSVRYRLVNTRDKLTDVLKCGYDGQLYNLINEIDVHITEIDKFKNEKKKSK